MSEEGDEDFVKISQVQFEQMRCQQGTAMQETQPTQAEVTPERPTRDSDEQVPRVRQVRWAAAQDAAQYRVVDGFDEDVAADFH